MTHSKVTLPSGRLVALLLASDPARPWELEGGSGVFHLRRLRRGDSSVWEYYASSTSGPLVLDLPDAEALAMALNARRGRMSMRSRPV